MPSWSNCPWFSFRDQSKQCTLSAQENLKCSQNLKSLQQRRNDSSYGAAFLWKLSHIFFSFGNPQNLFCSVSSPILAIWPPWHCIFGGYFSLGVCLISPPKSHTNSTCARRNVFPRQRSHVGTGVLFTGCENSLLWDSRQGNPMYAYKEKWLEVFTFLLVMRTVA